MIFWTLSDFWDAFLGRLEFVVLSFCIWTCGVRNSVWGGSDCKMLVSSWRSFEMWASGRVSVACNLKASSHRTPLR
eukprot:2054275-Amphidinium_carterae.1